MTVRYPYHSLEDFVTANMLTVDAQVDDGWGAAFPVKGREIEATVLFADITGFSARTAEARPDRDARVRKPLLHVGYRRGPAGPAGHR